LRVEQFLAAEQAATLQIAAEHTDIKPLECDVSPCLHIKMPEANSTKVGVALFVSCVLSATTGKISSIIVDIKEDEDVSFLILAFLLRRQRL